ncbi:MAG: endonuclease/exonuclease/phosphatase family protein [Pyrinomonadaceae bacterium]
MKIFKSKNTKTTLQNCSGNFALVAFFCGAILFFSAGKSAAQTVTPIDQIQGEGNISPFAGKNVSTRGIVTAILKKGFFIQTPDAEIDKNPKTSEGIYVFTNDAPMVAIGDSVQVDGTISEYRPRAERVALSVTELTRPSIKNLSKNNPLPAPIVLTTAELDPKGTIDQMEKFEGMRVKVDVLNVVAPTGGYTNEKTGEAKSNGVFWGVLAGTPRPFREAGVDGLTYLMDKLPQATPVFDMNPELLRVDSGAAEGANPIDATSGATVKNLTGVIDYAFRAYTLVVDAGNPPTVEGNKNFVPASPAGEREVTVGSFNMENFFDDEINSDDVKKETVLSKEAFERRLNKTSLAIRKVLSMPDVLGVCEMENLKVLKKVADKINSDAVAAGQPNPNYVPYLEEGNDIRGIDVGFLVKSSKVKVVEVKQLAKNEKLDTAGASEDAFLFDRPPLMLRAEVADAKTGTPFDFTVIVNHLKSYRGIDDPKDGDRVRQKRRLEAEWLARFVQERAAANPNERLILCGDFNAFQFNDGYNDLIGILKGSPNPNVLAPSTTIFNTGLIDLVDYVEAKNRYSYSYDGDAQAIDHILINKGARERALKFGYARLDADFPLIYENDRMRPERLSDHDAPIFYMSLDAVQPTKTQ